MTCEKTVCKASWYESFLWHHFFMESKLLVQISCGILWHYNLMWRLNQKSKHVVVCLQRTHTHQSSYISLKSTKHKEGWKDRFEGEVRSSILLTRPSLRWHSVKKSESSSGLREDSEAYIICNTWRFKATFDASSAPYICCNYCSYIKRVWYKITENDAIQSKFCNDDINSWGHVIPVAI